jgi:putative hydrolase of the HAD superfamily
LDPTRIAAVFLDAGNTILGMDYDFLARAISGVGFSTTAGAVARAEAAARVQLDVQLRNGLSTEAADVMSLFRELILDRLACPKGSIRAELGERAFNRQQLDRIWSQPLPGAAEAMAALAKAGFRLAVVSNADGQVARRLERAGLTAHLEFIADSHLLGVEKPDPRIFTLVLEKLGLRPEDVVHAGDLESVDVVGARRAGITPVLMDPFGFWGERGCVRVRDVGELARLLGCSPETAPAG